MIQRILPAGAVGEEAFRDPPDIRLYPEEAAAVRRAAPARRDEFATVRWCARRALTRLGLPPGPLPPDPHGAPRWPDGVTGSLTHCPGYRAAALARTTDVGALGIDAEPNRPLPGSVLSTIAAREEQAHVGQLRQSVPDVHWDRLLFSAKEAIYKTWYPLTGRHLEFDDAVVTFTAESSVFTARLRGPRARLGTRAEGRWLHHDGLLLTAVALNNY